MKSKRWLYWSTWVSYLREPYPFYYRNQNFLLFNLFIFAMSAGFNYFFRPFNVYVPEHKMDYFYISLIHSCTPVVISILLFPFFRVPHREDKWTIGKEIALIALFLFLVGIGQFLIRDLIYDNPDNWSWRYAIEEVRNTFLVGTLFMCLFISFNHNRLQYKNNKKAQSLTVDTTPSTEEQTISILTEVKADCFSLHLSAFVCAKAEGNYTDIYVHTTEGTEKLVKRISIKELTQQLEQVTYIIKTHRSYLINLHHIDTITGNAQGYRVTLKNAPITVAVSRNNIAAFEQALSLIPKEA